MLEATPPELAGWGITYEKIGFTFEHPISARFWIEYDKGDASKIQTMEVPRDNAIPMNKYVLAYVQSSNEQVSLTAITQSQSPLDRRSCSLGAGDISGSRAVSCALESLDIPLDKDITLYTTTIKPSWRYPEIPVKIFTVKAHFSSN